MKKILLRISLSVLFIAINSLSKSQINDSRIINYLPEDIIWSDNKAVPSGGKIAVLIGKPLEGGFYSFRLKFPDNHKVMSHTHPEDRIYTVVSGTFYIGYGDEFDEDKLVGFKEGSLCLVPAGYNHFQWAKSGETVVQVTGIGPTATTYFKQSDDPRK